MTRVRDELPDAGLAGVPHLEGIGDVAEHPVQGETDLPDFRTGVRVGVGHPHGEVNLATGQRQLSHPGGGRGDPAQWPQGQPDDGGAGHTGEQETQRGHRELRRRQDPR